MTITTHTLRVRSVYNPCTPQNSSTTCSGKKKKLTLSEIQKHEQKQNVLLFNRKQRRGSLKKLNKNFGRKGRKKVLKQHIHKQLRHLVVLDARGFQDPSLGLDLVVRDPDPELLAALVHVICEQQYRACKQKQHERASTAQHSTALGFCRGINSNVRPYTTPHNKPVAV